MIQPGSISIAHPTTLQAIETNRLPSLINLGVSANINSRRASSGSSGGHVTSCGDNQQQQQQQQQQHMMRHGMQVIEIYFVNIVVVVIVDLLVQSNSVITITVIMIHDCDEHFFDGPTEFVLTEFDCSCFFGKCHNCLLSLLLYAFMTIRLVFIERCRNPD
jgi:hypothetical protein